MITLTLQAASNPDYPGRPLPKASKVEIKSIAEGYAIFEKWRDDNELGAGNLGAKCGDVNLGKILLGYFSYNGRFWPNEDVRVEAVAPALLMEA